MRSIPTILLLVLLSCQGFAQQFLTGKIRRKDGMEPLTSVNVYNLTLRKHRLSDEAGNYRIQARSGDMVIFSIVGYHTDSIPVTAGILGSDFPVLLDVRVVDLQAVTVGNLSNYQLDSLARRQDYSWIYDSKPQPLLERQRQGDGVGVGLNVIPTGSSDDHHQIADWKKRISHEEEQHYVDFRYSRDYVSRLTHLQGDSLQQFMERYRPTYDYCRKAANVDILVFISDSYKKFEGGK